MQQPLLGRYRHYKGQEYELLHLARHSETEEWLAVYRQCYGDESVWVRPLSMFTEKVQSATGEINRFDYIAES